MLLRKQNEMVGNWFIKRKKNKEIQIMIHKDVLVRIDWKEVRVDGNKL